MLHGRETSASRAVCTCVRYVFTVCKSNMDYGINLHRIYNYLSLMLCGTLVRRRLFIAAPREHATVCVSSDVFLFERAWR